MAGVSQFDIRSVNCFFIKLSFSFDAGCFSGQHFNQNCRGMYRVAAGMVDAAVVRVVVLPIITL